MVFQLPLVMLALNRVGIVSHEAFVKNWRYVLLGVFVCAALFTPPDPFTQLMMAIPMVFLFLFGLILTSRAEKRPGPTRLRRYGPVLCVFAGKTPNRPTQKGSPARDRGCRAIGSARPIHREFGTVSQD